MALPVIAALIFTLGAAACDLRSRRIPNLLSLAGLLTGLGIWVYYRGWKGFMDITSGAGLLFCLGAALYALKGLGAGDVKFMTALGAITGAYRGIRIFLYAGVICILVWLIRGIKGTGIKHYIRDLKVSVQRMMVTGEPVWCGQLTEVPFAVYLLAGVVVCALKEGGWLWR